jgi:hypothetical protein
MEKHVVSETMLSRRPVRLERLGEYVKKSANEDFVLFTVLAEKGPIKEDKKVHMCAHFSLSNWSNGCCV